MAIPGANKNRPKAAEPSGAAPKASIEKPLADLAEIVVKAVQHADSLRDKGDLNALVKTMDRVDTLIKRIKSVSTQAQLLYDRVRFSLIPDVMDEAGTTKIGVEGLGLCYLTSYYDVKQEDKEAIRAWLIEQHLEDMISENINAQTLQAFVNRRMAEAAAAKTEPDLPMSALKLTPRTRAAIKSDGKGKKQEQDDGNET